MGVTWLDVEVEPIQKKLKFYGQNEKIRASKREKIHTHRADTHKKEIR